VLDVLLHSQPPKGVEPSSIAAQRAHTLVGPLPALGEATRLMWVTVHLGQLAPFHVGQGAENAGTLDGMSAAPLPHQRQVGTAWLAVLGRIREVSGPVPSDLGGMLRTHRQVCGVTGALSPLRGTELATLVGDPVQRVTV
jgi:hypothetical protein